MQDCTRTHSGVSGLGSCGEQEVMALSILRYASEKLMKNSLQLNRIIGTIYTC